MVCCRVVVGDVVGDVGGGVVYIMTLGVVVLARRRGVGAKLLGFVEEVARDNNCKSVQLHVHVANEDATEFYKKFGFDVKERIGGYYKYLKPPDALLLQKDY